MENHVLKFPWVWKSFYSIRSDCTSIKVAYGYVRYVKVNIWLKKVSLNPNVSSVIVETNSPNFVRNPNPNPEPESEPWTRTLNLDPDPEPGHWTLNPDPHIVLLLTLTSLSSSSHNVFSHQCITLGELTSWSQNLGNKLYIKVNWAQSSLGESGDPINWFWL